MQSAVCEHHAADLEAHKSAFETARNATKALAALRTLLSNDPTQLGYVDCLAEVCVKQKEMNAVGPDGTNPLLLACALGDGAAAAALLAAGADPMAAGEVWHPEFDKLLGVEAGKRFVSPLMTAARTGNVEIAELLLAHYGVDANQAVGDDGRTALSCAARYGQPSVVKILLGHDGIDANRATCAIYIDAIITDGTTPLYMACENGHDEVVKLLLAHDGIDANKGLTDDETTPLSVACENGHDGVVKLMLAHDGIDANKPRTDIGTTPLYMPCQNGHDEIVKLLLAHDGIDANKAETVTGCTPLIVACIKGHDEVVKLMLAHDGIDANKATTDNGTTPLSVACQDGHDGVVKLLLAHAGIDANKGLTDDETTPLCMACNEGRAEVVKLLLAHDGIDANKAETDGGATPLYNACQQGHDEIVKLLLAHDGIDANKATTDDGNTPLHGAVFSGNLLVAQHLVTCGADMNATDNYDQTPAQDAAGDGNQPTLVAWLGAVAGWPTLRVAAGCRLHRELATLLRQGRMDPDILTTEEILAAIATSTAEPDALPWDDAPPICKETIAVVADATRGWHRSTHWLHHANVRGAVVALLIVADRLKKKAALLPLSEEGQPTLPPEIWLYCMGFLLRSWWAV